MDIPEAIKPYADAVAAFQIYAECWKSTADKQVAIENAADSLNARIVSSHDPEGCIYSSVDALRYYSCAVPQAVDLGLDIFRKAATKIPDTIEHPYGKGPGGAENTLKWYLVESATFFQGNVPPRDLGKEGKDKFGPNEGSNLLFTRSDVDNSRSAVLQKLEDWQKDRLDIIVVLTMLGSLPFQGFCTLESRRLYR